MTWHSGSPKRMLYSTTFGPVGRDHDPAIQDTRGTPRRAARSSVSVGQIARSITSSTISLGTNGTGVYAPIPPVFGPWSPSNARLWSCAVANGTRVRTVAEHEDRELGSGHALLDDAHTARVAERLARQVRAHCCARVGDRLGDDDTLPRGQAVGLDDVQPGERLEEAERLVLLPGAERAVRARSAPRRSRARPSSRLWTLRARPRRPSIRTRGVRPHRARRRPRRPAVPPDRSPRDRGAGRRRAPPPRPGRSRRPVDTRRARPSRGCPARQKRSSTSGERASPHASACSRPPLPMTSAARRSTRRAGNTTVWSRAGPTPTNVTGTPRKSSMNRT